jgi:hypothetical protein
MQYRDEAHAVVRAMNAGEGRPKPALWQMQYTSGYRESAVDDLAFLTGMEKLLADSMCHRLIRKTLTPPQYYVLVLKYSGNEGDRIKALKSLLPLIGTQAGPQSKALSIGAWAGYKSPNANYDQQDAADSTIRGWRMQIKRELDKLHGDAFTRLADAMKGAGLISID